MFRAKCKKSRKTSCLILFAEMAKRSSEGEEDSAKKRPCSRSPVSDEKYISSLELYTKVKENEHDYLLIDTRSEDDFFISTVISDRNVNIPVADLKL